MSILDNRKIRIMTMDLDLESLQDEINKYSASSEREIQKLCSTYRRVKSRHGLEGNMQEVYDKLKSLRDELMKEG